MRKLVELVGIAGGLALLFTGCPGAGAGGGGDGGSGGEGTAPPNGDNPRSTYPGFEVVEGHYINPEFLDNPNGEWSNVYISYFNDDGLLTSYHEIYAWTDDTVLDANEYFYDYRADGNVREITIRARHGSYTGEEAVFNYDIERSEGYEYNAQGSIVEITKRNETDNVTDEVITYTYSNGKMATMFRDDGGDGELTNSNDEQFAYEYDGSGRLTLETKTSYTGLKSHKSYSYNADGTIEQLSEYRSDEDLDQNEPWNLTYYEYDAQKRLVAKKSDFDNNPSSDPPQVDGNYNLVERFVYGAEGELSEYHEESATNLTYQTYQVYSTLYMYDVVDSDGDGSPDTSTVYENTPAPYYIDPHGDRISMDDGGYEWLGNYNDYVNDPDGGLNWEGHDTGTCSTCGNMIGEVNEILLGF